MASNITEVQEYVNSTVSGLNSATTTIKIPYIAISFIVICIISVLGNSLVFLILMKYGAKKAYSFFVMSLCVGNCLIGCSVLFSTVRLLQGNTGTPFSCTLSLWATTSGILINIGITFWIALERYLIVYNIPLRKVIWMEDRKFFIIFCTFGCLIVYSSLIFLLVQDNTARVCDGIHVFGKNRPFYVTLTTFPLLCLLIMNVVLHRKTLSRLSTLRISTDQKLKNNLDEFNQKSLFVTRNVKQSTSSQSTNSISQHYECSETVSKHPRHITQMAEISTFTESDFESYSNIVQDDRDIVVNFEENFEQPCIDGDNLENPVQSDSKSHSEKRKTVIKHAEISWQTKCQNTVRILIIQVLIYGLSMILGQISASFGFPDVRTILVGLTVICVFTCPFVYVHKVPEVKAAMQKTCSRRIAPLESKNDDQKETTEQGPARRKHLTEDIEEIV